MHTIPTKYLMLLGCLMLTATACKNHSFDKKMVKKSQNFTRLYCPKEVNTDTMLDSMVYDCDTHTLYYYYSLHGPLDNQEFYTEEVLQAHRENIVEEIKNSITLKEEKQEGIQIGCKYLSPSTGNMLFELVVTADEYNTAQKK